MGKLLQKLVNRVVPSWLTKIKSSVVDTSPKKLALPYFKGSTHVSSPPSPYSSTTRHTEVPRPLVAYDNPDQSKEDVNVDVDDDDDDDDGPCAKAYTENSVTLMNPSSTKERTSKPKPHKSTQIKDHQHQDHNDPHQPHHVDVKISSINQGMHRRCDADIRTHSGTPSSRKQGAESIHIDKHDHHPQHHQKNRKNQPGPEKRNQCMPEADNRHHQEARRGRSDVARQELCEFLELDREGNVRGVREDNVHNYPDDDYSHEAEFEEEHYKNLYHDLLGIKRKSQYLQEEEEEEGEEETDGGGSSSMYSTGWGGKRRRGERGRTSCELPESICGIVGNGRAVVKHSQEPHMALWESMVEMIVGNGLWDLGSLEFLLFCYLSLNEPHLHPIIHSSFLQVLQDLEKV